MKITGFVATGLGLLAFGLAGHGSVAAERAVTYLPADKVAAAFAKGMPLVDRPEAPDERPACP